MNDPTNPFEGIPDALKPNPPASVPEPQIGRRRHGERFAVQGSAGH